MWPWSTIRGARADAEKFAARCGHLTKENEQLRQRWTTLNESYEELQRHARTAENALSKEAEQRLVAIKERDEAIKTAELWESAYNKANTLWVGAHEREASLLVQLSKALVRDAKTGRLTKWSPIQSVAGGSASNELGH